MTNYGSTASLSSSPLQPRLGEDERGMQVDPYVSPIFQDTPCKISELSDPMIGPPAEDERDAEILHGVSE